MGAQKLLQETESSNYQFNLYSFCYATMAAAVTNRGIQGDERANIMFLARTCGMNWISKEFIESLSASKAFSSQQYFLKSMTLNEKIFFTACIKQIIKADTAAADSEVNLLNLYGKHMGFSSSEWGDITPKVEKILKHFSHQSDAESPINYLNILHRIPALLTLIELAASDGQQDPREHKILQNAMKSIKANDRYSKFYLPEIYASGLAFFIEMYLRKDKPFKNFSDGVFKYLVQYLSKDHFTPVQKYLLLTSCVHLLGLSNKEEYLGDEKALKLLTLIFELDQEQTNNFFQIIKSVKDGKPVAVSDYILMASLMAYTRIETELTKLGSSKSNYAAAISFMNQKIEIHDLTVHEQKKLIQRTLITMSTGGDLNYEETKVCIQYLNSALNLGMKSTMEEIEQDYQNQQPLARYLFDEIKKIKHIGKTLKTFNDNVRSDIFEESQKKAFESASLTESSWKHNEKHIEEIIKIHRQKEDAEFLARKHRLNTNYEFMVKNQKKAGPELKAEFAKQIKELEAEVEAARHHRLHEDANFKRLKAEKEKETNDQMLAAKKKVGSDFLKNVAKSESILESEHNEFDDKLVYMDELLKKSDSYQEDERKAFLSANDEVPKKKIFGLF